MEDTSDGDVEWLLSDAYSAPPVPQTLLRRLDQAVSDQWGVSPQVAPRSPQSAFRAAHRVAGSWKSWPVAACLLLALGLLLFLRRDVQAYSWAAVVDAISRQALVQLGGGNTTESDALWLSVPDRKVGHRSGGVDRLYDLGQGVVLERDQAETRIKRFRLSDGSGTAAVDRLVLSVLARELGRDGGTLRLPGWRLAHEGWSRTGDAVELRVAFVREGAADELSLTLVVDPETHLPRRYTVRGGKGPVREEVVTYPSGRAEQLVARAFPADFPIEDVTSAVVAVAPVDGATPPPQHVAEARLPGEVAEAGASGARPGGATQPTVPEGAASLGWSPLAASPLSGAAALAEVNAALERLWRDHQVTPAEPASDAELLRRVFLDLTGRTPTVGEARTYLSDVAPGRFDELVDWLLASQDHATHLAAVWRSFLLPEGVDLSRLGGVSAFDAWLSGRFGSNVPYDQLVRELLLAEGRLSQSGPLLFYSAAKLDADQLAARTARVFLGMRLECAQCHDDPFEPWTQRDFWSYAAFFARISRPDAPLESVSTVMRVHDIDRGEVMMPGGKVPIAPRFLDGTAVDESPSAAARRQQLARWLTGAGNPFFARAAVNRVWAHMFGRGIVDPVDGFGRRHPPRSAELLDLLAAQFISSGYDLREMFRMIARTRAYQLSSGAGSDDPVPREWFAQMHVKMLTAEQVYDCITVASMLVATESSGFAIERVGNAGRDEFLQQFKTVAGRPVEYQGGIPQALTLMNGELIRSATDLAGSGLLKSLEAPFFTDDERVEVIYLATLSRRPTAGEWPLLRGYLNDRAAGLSLQDVLADILWALLNSAEFTMNH